MQRTTLIVLAARRGDPTPSHLAPVPRADRVLAVDSGLHLALGLGLAVDVVIGDLDSVEPGVLDQARANGIEIDVHPRDKDHTDLALALSRARREGTDRIFVIGGAGGRLDHGLANLVALADPALAPVHVEANLGGAHVTVVRDVEVTLAGAPGSLVSLVAVGGPAVLSTTGLRWDLHDEALQPTATRGISNELLDATARVTTSSGTALAIQPATEEALER